MNSKNKVARREAADLELKTPGSKAHASLLKRINILPGQHGTRKRRKISERGKQLREKQKLRFLFGLSDKQLKNYFKRAIKTKGTTTVILCNLLEKRLDNAVFRLGLAPTRASARQLITHKHIKINGKIVNIPSYQTAIDEVISLADEKSQKIPYIESILANKSVIIPKWFERKETEGCLVAEPSDDLIEKQVNLQSVIEYFSR